MPDLLWCALAGLVAGAVISAPVWLWAAYRERRRQVTYARLLREASLLRKDDALGRPAPTSAPPAFCRDTGWFPWIAHLVMDIDHSPYAYRQVEIARAEWNGSQIVDPRTLDPATNVVDLWWRPVQDHA
jgi:hypothetical protein